MSYSYHKPFTGIAAHILYTTAALSTVFYLGINYYHYVPGYPSVTKAVAIIHPIGNATPRGIVTFEQQKDGVHVTAHITHLTPGKHGFHIHEHGDSSCPDGMCTGGHYNPTNTAHGGRDSKERHVGDFGNLQADAAGVAHLEFVDKALELNGPCSIIGRGLIVHADEDDLVSQPTGNSGARIGCGVIGRAQ